MADTRKKLLFAASVTFCLIGLLALGAWIGFTLRDRALRDQFARVEQAETLSGVLHEPGQAEEVASVYLDPRTALDRLSGISWAVPNVPTPFVGSGPSPGVHDSAAINSLQFRDSRELESAKPPQERRIFLTGGSTAFGSGAPSNETIIGGYLEKLLNQGDADRRYRVFTFANPAWSSTHERIAIENRLSELKPDLVISFSGVNDVHWGQTGRNVLWFRTYYDQHFWRLARDYNRIFGAGELVDVEDRRQQPVGCETVAARLRKNVLLAKSALSMNGTPYLWVLQPSLYSTGKSLTPREEAALVTASAPYFRSCYRKIRTSLQSIDEPRFHYRDFSTVFDRSPASDEIFLDSYHFGDRGYRILGRELKDVVTTILP